MYLLTNCLFSLNKKLKLTLAFLTFLYSILSVFFFLYNNKLKKNLATCTTLKAG